MTVKTKIGLGAGALVVLFVGIFPDAVVGRVFACQRWRDELGAIDFSDGIQKAEADVIASRYEGALLGSWSACSGTTTPTLVDGVWRAQILFGFGGEPTGHWISVNPISGGVSAPGGPRYATYASFRRAALVHAVLYGR